ncbi:MAG: lipopolysaccharide heptosyltransferase I [Porticoccus sp.]
MIRVLVIKTSSLGDVIHTLPAINDAISAIPDITFDWVVEENFSEIPGWNSKVNQIIPVALRRWRKNPFRFWYSSEWAEFKRKMSLQRYDAIIDAQGLLKSAWLAKYANGQIYGFDKYSAREPLASNFYHHPVSVPKNLHAVERTRLLFSKSLGYSLNSGLGKYNLSFELERQQSVVLLHGTTWASKHWSEESWIKLSGMLIDAGYRVFLPWGDEIERQRAERISQASGAKVLPRMSLTEIASTLSASAGCISVDTGLGHLAVAVNTPTLAIFGPTNPFFTGFYGLNQKNLASEFKCVPCMSRKCLYPLSLNQAAPCFGELTATRVFDEFAGLIEKSIFPETVSIVSQTKEFSE